MQDPNSAIDKEWPEPQPLERVQPPTWPENVFPVPFEKFIRELSRSTETPIELSAMIALSVIASIYQKKYVVQVKEDYAEPTNLWTAVVLPPASRKSKVFNEVMKPIKEWEFAEQELLKPLVESMSSQRKTQEGRIKELRNLATKATNPEEYNKYQMEVEHLEQTLPSIPNVPQLWTGDVTPEHLGTLMASNNDSMAVLSDEGGIFDILAGLYSNGQANIDLFLQAHAASSVRVDRGSRPPIMLKRAVLSMGLTFQPETIRNICRNRTFRGRGLLGRFLYAYPASNIGRRTFAEPPIDLTIQIEYDRLVKVMLDKTFKEDKGNKPLALRMSDTAYAKFLEYAIGNEVMMSEECGRLTEITDWAGKLPGAMARIAGILHLIRYAEGDPSEHLVSFEDMASAVKIGHALSYHALKIFDELQISDSMEMARKICFWLKQERRTSFTLREANRRFRNFKKDVRAATLDILVEYDIIKTAEPSYDGKPGRKSNIYEVNPRLHDK